MVAITGACVLRPGEPLTSPRVIRRVGPPIAVALHPYWQPGEEAYMTEELIREMSLTGPVSEVIARVRELEAAGVRQCAIRVVGTDGREAIQEFGREIIAKYA